MSICPECCGKCDPADLELIEFGHEDRDLWKCPRCNKIFWLVEVEPSELPEDIHIPEQRSKNGK